MERKQTKFYQNISIFHLKLDAQRLYHMIWYEAILRMCVRIQCDCDMMSLTCQAIKSS